VATIKQKTELAKREGLAGVMIWEISQDTQDDRSLLKAINEAAGKE
jgi:GH18 family chitinase